MVSLDDGAETQPAGRSATMTERVYKSKKTASQFIARGEPNRAYLIV